MKSAAHLIRHQLRTCLRDAVLHLPGARQRNPSSPITLSQRTEADQPHSESGEHGAAQAPLVRSPHPTAIRRLASSSRPPNRLTALASRVVRHGRSIFRAHNTQVHQIEIVAFAQTSGTPVFFDPPLNGKSSRYILDLIRPRKPSRTEPFYRRRGLAKGGAPLARRLVQPTRQSGGRFPGWRPPATRARPTSSAASSRQLLTRTRSWPSPAPERKQCRGVGRQSIIQRPKRKGQGA